jgi:hypothetical protein
MFSEAILGTFRNMLNECLDKKMSGEEVDAMKQCFARMEQLAAETDDMAVFNANVLTENLYGKFSDYYGRALAAASRQEYANGTKTYDDASLLKTSLNALKDAIKRLRDNYQETLRMSSTEYNLEQSRKSNAFVARSQKGLGSAVSQKQLDDATDKALKANPDMLDNTVEAAILNDPEPLIRGIQNLIDLGEQPGMSFPRFLRLQIETGLDQAMQGTAVLRDGLIYTQEFTEALPATPMHRDIARRKIEAFDQLAAANRFGVPDIHELNHLHDDIDREYEPAIRRWNAIKNLWGKMFDDLYDWSLAHCSFSPHIQPWAMAPNPVEATIYDQNVIPGVFKQRELLLQRYFGIGFMDIFKHPTFAFDVEYHYFPYSQELMSFLIDQVYPACIPCQKLPAEIVKRRGEFHAYSRNPGDREMNPNLHKSAERMQAFYDGKFGAGRYEAKFGPVEVNKDAYAAPWDWAGFPYK